MQVVSNEESGLHLLSQPMDNLTVYDPLEINKTIGSDYDEGLADSEMIAISEAVESGTSSHLNPAVQQKSHFKRPGSVLSKNSISVPEKRAKLSRESPDLERLTRQEMTRITGADTFLSSQQGRWCHFLQEMPRQSSLSLIIMPTGGGKSLLFMLPASLESGSLGITIVIVPFKVLLHDLQRRCKEKQITAILWETYRACMSKTTTFPSVLLISAESTKSDSFLSWLQYQIREGSIQRVFFDECHVILDAHYRDTLLNLSLLSNLQVPLVLLSATIPVKYEETIINSFGRTFDLSKAGLAVISDRESKLSTNIHLQYIDHSKTVDRCSTTQRFNIQYEVQLIPRGCTLAKGLKNLLQSCISGLNGSAERVLVYFNTIYLLSDMLSYLNEDSNTVMKIYTFHRKQEDSINQDNMKEWLKGSRGKIMFATAALGCGLDYGRIRYVIHIGLPKSLIDIAQEAGRGARSSAQAYATYTVLISPSEIRSLQQSKQESQSRQLTLIDLDRFEVLEFLAPHTSSQFSGNLACRRTALSRSLDGQEDITCNNLLTLLSEDVQGIEVQRCDLCAARHSLQYQSKIPHSVSVVTSPVLERSGMIQAQNSTASETYTKSTSHTNHQQRDLRPTPVTPTPQDSKRNAGIIRSRQTSRSGGSCLSKSTAPRSVQPNQALFDHPAFISGLQLTRNLLSLFDLIDSVERSITDLGLCAICYLLASSTDGAKVPHDPCVEGAGPCTMVYNLDIQHFINSIRSQIQFEDFSCCFGCRLPQFVCRGGQKDGTYRFSSICSKTHLRDVVLAPVYMFWQVGLQNQMTGWSQYNPVLSKLFTSLSELHTEDDAKFMAYISKSYKIQRNLTVSIMWMIWLQLWELK